MRVSVVIPTYNSSATIAATLESVLRQTVAPDEIVVLDDGSTDSTVSILDSYRHRITLFRQKNAGVANARNTLCQKARGDLIAFLDHDDIWHPRYLEAQLGFAARFPEAVAFFTGHLDFYGYGTYEWNGDSLSVNHRAEVIDSLRFSRCYNERPGPFASMSYCCIPAHVLRKIGSKPFCAEATGADDFYLFNLLPLFGPVVYAPQPLVAYRITTNAQSANLLRSTAASVIALELLDKNYRRAAESKLGRALGMALATRRRGYSRILMGTRNICGARMQLRRSLRDSSHPFSMTKSLAWLFLTYMPSQLQQRVIHLRPKWASSHR